MKSTRIITIFSLVVLSLAANSTAPAQENQSERELQALSDSELDKAMDKWIRDYVRYIITEEEKVEWKGLSNRDDKVMFIEHFWQRRDPTPETRENEYRAEYIQRWLYVKQHFTAGKPGWRTDRGRIYLMLGAPSSVERNPFGRNRTERPSEVWYYNSINNRNLPASVDISFVDFMGYGDYEIVTDLDQTARFNSSFGIAMNNLDAYALRRMGDVRPVEDVVSTMWDEARITHPELLSRDLFELQRELSEIAETPKLNVRPLREVVRTEIARGDLSFALSAGIFKAAAGNGFVPVTIAVPLSNISFRETPERRDYEIELYARVHGDNGSDTYEEELKISFPRDEIAGHADADYVYQFWFTVPPGQYKLNLTIRDNLSGSVGHQQEEISVPVFDGGSLAMSDMIVADQVSEAPENEIARRNEAAPFRFANLRVIPNVKREIPSNKKEFFLYFHVYNFSTAGEDSTSDLAVQYYVYREGGLFSKTPAFQLRRRFTDRAAVQSGFPVVNFEAGAYRIVAVVRDNISGEEVRGECTFSVVPAATLELGKYQTKQSLRLRAISRRNGPVQRTGPFCLSVHGWIRSGCALRSAGGGCSGRTRVGRSWCSARCCRRWSCSSS